MRSPGRRSSGTAPSCGSAPRGPRPSGLTGMRRSAPSTASRRPHLLTWTATRCTDCSSTRWPSSWDVVSWSSRGSAILRPRWPSSGTRTRTADRRKPVSTTSIDEVAAAAGVDRSTVSRAVSRPEAVKRETRDHVRRVAASMGYTMSPLAQALRTKTSTLVPLIVPDITNPFFAELAKAMTAAAQERGYQLVLCVTENDAGATAGYLRAMQSMYAPFALLAPFASVDPDELESFGFGRRLVVIDRVESNHQVPTVTVDSAIGIQLAFDHLVELGHTSIAYVSGIVGTHTAADRRGAYRELSGLHRMAPIELNAGIGLEAGERAADELVSMLQRPSAVIAANDMVAFGLISSLGSRGLSVPNDVSVVGFDGLVLGARSNPPLTSVQQPIAEMGRIAISLAERAAQNGRVEDVVLQPRLLVRSSTGPAR